MAGDSAGTAGLTALATSDVGAGLAAASTAPRQYDYVGGMLVVIAAMVVIVLLCRWVFSTGHRDERTAKRLERARARGDYGLLVPVATVRSQPEAEGLRGRLRDAGIRGTVAEGAQPGELVVLVFRDEAARARAHVGQA